MRLDHVLEQIDILAGLTAVHGVDRQISVASEQLKTGLKTLPIAELFEALDRGLEHAQSRNWLGASNACIDEIVSRGRAVASPFALALAKQGARNEQVAAVAILGMLYLHGVHVPTSEVEEIDLLLQPCLLPNPLKHWNSLLEHDLRVKLFGLPEAILGEQLTSSQRLMLPEQLQTRGWWTKPPAPPPSSPPATTPPRTTDAY